MRILCWFLILIGSSWGNFEENFRDEKTGILKFGHFIEGSLAEPFVENETELLEVSQNWMEQPLDHFNISENATWSQRYWNNTNFYNPNCFGQNCIIFLMIGGNSGINEKWISNPNVTYLQWAKKLKALVFLLEHRFYGESQPTEDLSDQNLKYLSSKQALKDIDNFIQTIKNENKDKFQNSKWVTFGGGYGGTLSAWFREKFPESSIIAIGSSAPLHIKINFFEYLQVVQRSLTEYDGKCAENIAFGFSEIFSDLYDINQTKHLNTVFKFSHILNNSYDSFQKDSQVFFSSIISAFQAAVQYNGINSNPYINGFGIENVCEIMIQNLNYKENLQKVFSYMNGNDIIDSGYLRDIEILKNASLDGINSDVRAWLWQSCTEFGSFQSTDLGRNIFGSTVSVDFFIDLCTDVFGFERSDIDILIDSTKQYYGELRIYNATNVALLNGSKDPWHALGYYPINTTSHAITSIFINGTSHCADMYPASSSDSVELVLAREQVERLLNHWIN